MTFGGNTSCVEVVDGSDRLICDMGSGLRELGGHLLATSNDPKSLSLDIIMSHVHWDHIQGFPFFAPAYIPGAKIRVWGCHSVIEHAIRRQHTAPSFPVEYHELGADISYHPMQPGQHYEISGFDIVAREQAHPGLSYGYRISRDNRTFVYATDIEHRVDDTNEIDDCVSFFLDANAVVFDAMFAWGEAQTVRQEWGHSSNVMGVDLCLMAKAKHLILFHHDPRSSDAALHHSFIETCKYLDLSDSQSELQITSAYDGLIINI